MKSDTWLMNPKIKPEIYIDIDTPYLIYIYSFHYIYMKKKINYLKEVFGDIEVYIRKSSSGNTHLKLEFKTVEIFEGFTFYDSLIIRAYLDDDEKRIRADCFRYFVLNDIEETNRIFDCKIKNDIVYNAGEWTHLNPLWIGEINDKNLYV